MPFLNNFFYNIHLPTPRTQTLKEIILMSLHFRVLNDKDMYFIPTNVFSIFILVYVSCDLCNMNLKNMRKQKQTHNLQFLSKKKQRYNALRSSPTQFEKMHSAIQYAVPNAIQGRRKPSESAWDCNLRSLIQGEALIKGQAGIFLQI